MLRCAALRLCVGFGDGSVWDENPKDGDPASRKLGASTYRSLVEPTLGVLGRKNQKKEREREKRKKKKKKRKSSARTLRSRVPTHIPHPTAYHGPGCATVPQATTSQADKAEEMDRVTGKGRNEFLLKRFCVVFGFDRVTHNNRVDMIRRNEKKATQRPRPRQDTEQDTEHGSRLGISGEREQML